MRPANNRLYFNRYSFAAVFGYGDDDDHDNDNDGGDDDNIIITSSTALGIHYYYYYYYYLQYSCTVYITVHVVSAGVMRYFIIYSAVSLSLVFHGLNIYWNIL